MNMEERVENLLKIAREIDDEGDARSWEIGRLKDGLQELIQDTELRKKLAVEWEKMVYEKRLARWDEGFLKVVAGEDETEMSVDSRGRPIRERVRQGAPITYPTTTTGATLSVPDGAGTGATWSNIQSFTREEMEVIKEMAKKQGSI